VSQFKRAVEEAFRNLIQDFHPVQGYIPRGGVNFEEWTCTVRVPDQHMGSAGGLSATGGTHLEYEKVPLPRQPDGLIHSPVAKISERDCGVLIGFRGSALFPFIIQFLDLEHEIDGKQKTKVEQREPTFLNNFLTSGPAIIGSTLPGGIGSAKRRLQGEGPTIIPRNQQTGGDPTGGVIQELDPLWKRIAQKVKSYV
jgi:hypothetical protein